MPHVYLVEDEASSVIEAIANINETFPDVNLRVLKSPSSALEMMRDVENHKTPAPTLIILDLDFTSESGFEVLRHWKSSKCSIPIIVWTRMGKTYQELSTLFGVYAVVSKHSGCKALIDAIRPLIAFHDALASNQDVAPF